MCVLQSIHRTVVELRKQAALSSPRGRPLQVWSANMASSEASSVFTASFGGASTPASSRAVSKAGAPGSGAAPHHLAELGAKAAAAASRPLVVSSAVDSSLQAVQAAKESLQSMHDKDMTLKLFSQSVQDVLARKVGCSVCCALAGRLQEEANLPTHVVACLAMLWGLRCHQAAQLENEHELTPLACGHCR